MFKKRYADLRFRVRDTGLEHTGPGRGRGEGLYGGVLAQDRACLAGKRCFFFHRFLEINNAGGCFGRKNMMVRHLYGENGIGDHQYSQQKTHMQR